MKKLLLMFFFGTMAYAQPAINQPSDLSACDDNYDGQAFFDLTVNNTVMVDNPALYNITYHSTLAAAQYGVNIISDPVNFYSIINTVYASVSEIANPNVYSVATINLIVLPKPAIPETPDMGVYDNDGIPDGFTSIDLTVYNTAILGNDSSLAISFHETQEDAQYGVNAIANPETYINIVSQTQTIYVRLTNNNSDCYSTGTLTVTILSEPFLPPPPTGEVEQSFNEGDTLADIEIDGENIQWYDNSGEMPDFPDGMDEPLPLSTVLVDGTTYYASQTINGVESNTRLGVTVNFTAGLEDNALNGLSYYPNPANNILNIENANGIDSIKVANALGQSVFTKSINSNSTQMDVSSLSKGVYFVTIASGSASKNIKIIKE